MTNGATSGAIVTIQSPSSDGRWHVELIQNGRTVHSEIASNSKVAGLRSLRILEECSRQPRTL